MGQARRVWLGAAGRGLLWLAGAVGGQAVHAADLPPALPAEVFFKHPDMGEVRLSPSGRQLAVAVRRNQRLVLAVIDLEGQRAPTVVVNYDDADVARFAWVNEQRLVYTVTDEQEGGASQRFWSGLYAVGADGSHARQLVRIRQDFLVERKGPGREPLNWNHQLLMVPRTGGDEVIVGKFVGDRNWDLASVMPLRLNVNTQQLRSLAMGMPEHVTHWLFDNQGEPRVAMAVHAGRFLVHWRQPGSDSWKLLADMPNLQRSWEPVSVDEQGGLYVTVTTGAQGITVLKRFDFASGQPAAEPLVRAEGFDFQGELIRDVAGPALGVRALTDAETTVWFAPRLKQWQQDADQRFPGRINRLDCRRCASEDPVVLVRSWSDRQPGELWVYRPLRKDLQWNAVGATRKDVQASRMATLDFFRIKARDGLEMPLWLTLPLTDGKPTTEANKQPRPAVVLVHGGPWVRGGSWQWDGEAQFLASRGYVVIQPEYRGSEGYGNRLFSAGIKQWGQAMQNDLADALQWAVKQGHVDPNRVCIAGGSYGGYAALMGPIRHPGLYRCVAAWMAVTDLHQRLKSGVESDLSEENRQYALPQLMGDPVADAAMLTDNSPLTHAAQIKVPVLMAVGAKDRRVPMVHGERMRDALRAAGNPPQWEVYPDEGHGWYKAESHVDFARKLEAFLAQHLK